MHSSMLLPLFILGFARLGSCDFGAACEDGKCGDDASLLQVSREDWGKGSTCKPIQHDCSNKTAGYLYVGLNGEGENKVLSVERLPDGSLGKQRVFGTGSDGGADSSKPILSGDYDGQGGLQIIGEYLLVVNGGGNTVSTFLICQDGSLHLVNTVPSGGGRPVTLTFTPKKSGGKPQQQQQSKSGAKGKGDQVSGGEYWVVVGNQFTNAIILGDKSVEELVYLPNKSYHLDHLFTTPNPDLNMYLFSFDASSGKLTPEKTIESFPETWGGPATVAFNSDGTKLAMATWGIAHDFLENPIPQSAKMALQQPSRLYVYDFDRQTGESSNKRYFQSCGDSGFVGFSWHPTKDLIYLAAFNTVNAKGLKVFSDSGSRVTLKQEFGADEESCWTNIHPNQKHLYVANFLANSVTQFDLGDDGLVSRFVSNVARQNQVPSGDTKDMWIDPAGNNFYVQGSGESLSIAWYSICSASGNLGLQKEVKVEELINDKPYTSNFIGIQGYELCASEVR